jgi:O-antigen ligase
MAGLTLDRPRTASTVVLPLTVAVFLAAALVAAPLYAAAGVVALAVGTLLVLRLEESLLLLVAISPFEAYVTQVSAASVKLVGLLVFAAWLLRLLLDRGRTPLKHPAVRAAALLVVIALAAAVRHTNGGIGLQVLSRYVSFAATLVVVVDLFRRAGRPWRLAAVFVSACTLSGLAGLYSFAALHYDRAHGPLEDANDLAFFLVAALPFALALYARTRRRRWLAASGLLLVGTAATLSRGAVVALVALVLWALATGHLKPRTALAGVGLAVAGLVTVAALVPSLVTSALSQKTAVAAENVSTRELRWEAAANMAVDHPLLGLGPAGFRLNYARYSGHAEPGLRAPDVAHEMYLEVAAELGVPALLVFLGLLAACYAAARRAARRERLLAAAVQGSLVAMTVAALFLTEQYFLPLWLVAGLGAALDLRRG